MIIRSIHLTPEELNVVRQWFNAVKDINPSYLTMMDRDVIKRVEELISETELYNRQYERISPFMERWLQRFEVVANDNP